MNIKHQPNWNFCSIIAAISLALISCVEEYNYKIKGGDQTLVVEGFISDRIGEQKVRLSLSGQLNRTVEYVDDALVEVHDNVGNIMPYQSSTQGYYMPVDPEFIAQAEKSYRLVIKYAGQTYNSDPVLLPKTLEIDSVLWLPSRFDSIQPPAEGLYLSLKVRTNQDETATKYYRYSIDQTYELETIIYGDSVIEWDNKQWIENQYLFNGTYICSPTYGVNYYHIAPPEVIAEGKITKAFVDADPYNLFPNCGGYLVSSTVFNDDLTFWDMIPRKVLLQNIPKTCWANKTVYNVAEFDLSKRITNYINFENIYFLELGYSLSKRYSALVKQYALPEKYYQYHQLSKKFSVGEESLYSVQPGFVEGNLYCSSIEEKVIGFFYATSIKTKRVFIEPTELPSIELLEVINSTPNYKTRIDTLVSIDTIGMLMDTARKYTPDVYQYYRAQNLLERTEDVKYFLTKTNTKVTAYYIIHGCCDEACATFCDFVFINPSWCYDCRYFGESEKPAFW